MRRFLASSSGLDKFFAAQFSAGYITSMFGFDLRQAHPNQLAKSIVDIATGSAPPTVDSEPSAASQLGRLAALTSPSPSARALQATVDNQFGPARAALHAEASDADLYDPSVAKSK